MLDPLRTIRQRAHSVADAIRWACILEATAPKAGNVYPGQSFEDLTYVDFVIAANVAAEKLTMPETPIGYRMVNAITETRRQTKSNVNLGIILLLGPLVLADESVGVRSDLASDTEFVSWNTSMGHWRSATANVLSTLSEDDGKQIFEAIRSASAGGLGAAESMDVNDTQPGNIDILKAMQAAQSRDRIAQQYATGFEDLLANVVPVVDDSIKTTGDVLAGLAEAHLKLLAEEPDSLIRRKCDDSVAEDVSRRARMLDHECPTAVDEFDNFLRSRGNSLNPGTTADLIAAALFVLLRSPGTREPS